MAKSMPTLTPSNTATQIDSRTVSPSKRKSSFMSSTLETLDGKEIVKLEYEQLNEWARHGEESAHRIFNFYVSLLTAVLGGFVLVTQVIIGSLQTILLIGSAVCGLLVIVGVTFLDALIGQYSRNIHYRIGIERIRAYFRRDPEIAVILSKLPVATLESDSETVFYTLLEGKLPTTQLKRTPWLMRLFASLFPVSTQQIFLTMVTSLLVGALMLLVWGLTDGSNWSGKVFLASSLAVVLSFLTQNIVVRIALQGPLDRLRQILSADTELPNTSGNGDQPKRKR